MLYNRYGILFVGACVALMSVAGGAGYFLVYPLLPDPTVASREQLLRWVVLRDLSQETFGTRQALVRRLDVEFDQAPDLAGPAKGLTDSQSTRLRENIAILVEPWFVDKVEHFAQLPQKERLGYVDRFLDRLEQWRKLSAACAKSQLAKGQTSMADLGVSLFDRVKASSQRAEGEKRKQMSAFLVAVETRWLWRQMPSLPFFGKAQPGQ